EYLRDHGLVLGVEVLAVLPPRIQVTVVLPQAGQARYRAAVFAGFEFFSEQSGIPIVESKHHGRTIYQMGTGGQPQTRKGARKSGGEDGERLAWWVEGEHVVLSFGTEKPADVVRRLDDKRRANLLANPLFRSVAGFKRFESVARGFVDLERCVQKAKSLGVVAEKVIEEVGLAALKNLKHHTGFAGRYQQTSIVFNLSR